jgi:hypothetical protein
MSVQASDQISVRSTDDHVEVVGLAEEDVERAITLYRAVAQEQTDARAALASHVTETMLRGGIDLVPAASQRQIQRSADLRRRLLAEQGAETYASLAAMRDNQESSVRTWVSRERRRHELFTVEVEGRTIIPRVQLTPGGEVDPLIAELLRPLLRSGEDSWSVWAWLTSPTGLLSGDVPAEVARTGTGIRRAHTAAVRHAAEVAGAGSVAHRAHHAAEVRAAREPSA